MKLEMSNPHDIPADEQTFTFHGAEITAEIRADGSIRIDVWGAADVYVDGCLANA